MNHPLRILAFILSILTSNLAFAQDKVVVIPLLKSSLPAVAAFDDDDDSIALPTSNTIIRTVVINAQSPGVVIANASGYFDLNNVASSWVVCSITKDSTATDDAASFISRNDDTGTRFVPFGATRGFEITAAGDISFRLICKEVGGQTEIADANLTVMFFPNKP